MKGCGCQTGILRFIPIPEADYFYIPCCIHDDNYEGGKISRKEADKELLAMCLQVISRDRSINEYRKTWLKICAYGYYLAVRSLGWMYYGKGKE